LSIKQNALEKFFCHHQGQRELAELLEEAFDVSFGNQYGGQYVWILDAKSNVAERFGLQKEIVALYSPHDQTDARALTNLENIAASPDFRHRIDKVVAVLIHEGDARETADLVKQATEWIIISIHADELRNKQRGDFFLRSKLAERIGEFDLFGMSSPIKDDKYFYGRDSLVQEILQRITVRKENSGIFGLRKTGKTSVLFALQRRLWDRGVVAEYIDCQSPGIYGGRWWQLLQEMSFRISHSLERRRSKKLVDSGVYDSENAANSFNRFVKRVLGLEGVSQIALLLDEIEFITPGVSNNLGQHWDGDFLPFWQTIRSVSQEVQGGLVFVVAGVNPSSVEQPHFEQIQNPIFQLAVPYYLESLGRDDIRDMVRSIGKYSGYAFDESCYQYLKDTYGGHPYLVRLACSEVIKSKGVTSIDRKGQISSAEFERVKVAIQARLSQPIKDILLSLVWWYPDEYDLLLLLARGDGDFVAEYTRNMPEKTIQFIKYGLVRGGGGGFAIRDLQDFLSRDGESYRNAISPFKRGDLPLEVLPEQADLMDLSELFEKRTQVEIALRKYLFMVLGYKCGFDDKAISDRIMKSMDSRGGRSDQGQLFVGRRPQDAINELFLSDLKPIFKKNWDDFGPIFDKNIGRFEMNMDTINIARRFEAHAKPVHKIDKADFLNSYSWFIGRLSKVPGLI
jgi:hypothetical protein